ncbi:hypothetical protein [Arthrobacter sp. EPSL27]|uniref:hypothetical protein n=1 Tax=Arthrobacter sp. EPSL27 TaxID=1745378 RepID=UPI0012FBAC59|nr:hypothetical protein [Arthrobacter sp. EPSL27]
MARQLRLPLRPSPRFCHAKYVGFAVCSRIGCHDGEHVTTGATGRLIGWDA